MEALRAMTSSPMTSNLIGQLSHKVIFPRVNFLTGRFSHGLILSQVNYLAYLPPHGCPCKTKKK